VKQRSSSERMHCITHTYTRLGDGAGHAAYPTHTSCPWDPKPHVATPPSSVTATACEVPQATERTLSPLKHGALTSCGVGCTP